MPEGGNLELSTSITSCEQGDQVCLQFKDSGHGLDEKQILTTTGLLQSKKPQGSGLGLMVVKKIVDLHGGTIGIRNAPHGGAQVTLILKTE